MIFTSLEKPRFYKLKIYDILKKAIIFNDLKSKQILNEQEIAENLNVNRTPVREALELLKHKGWVIQNGNYKIVAPIEPEDVEEIYTIVNVSKKVDRALKAGGDAIGAEVKIENVSGIMPLNPNEALDKVFLENAKKIFGEEKIGKCPHINGSTDMGDVSQIIPAIHPWIHVVKGKLHGADFGITDPYIAYIQSAKIISWTLIDLLANGAKKGLEIKSTSQSPMTKETWLSNWLEQIQI